MFDLLVEGFWFFLWFAVLVVTGFFSTPITEIFKPKLWRDLGFLQKLNIPTYPWDKYEKESPVKKEEKGRTEINEAKETKNETNVELEVKEQTPDKFVEKRNNILEEILSTETTYVENLKMLVERFLIPLKEKKILTKSSLESIFSNIEMVLNINSLFLQNLKETLELKNDREFKLAEMLTKFCHSFKLYTTYIANYEKGCETLKGEKAQNTQFTSFLSETAKKLSTENYRIFDLSSFLILPIQRLPRYRMLLEDLLKNTPVENKRVHQEVEKAAEQIRSVTSFLNSKQHEYGKMVRMITLNEILGVKNLIQPHRQFVKECDNVKLYENGQYNPISLYLFSDILVFLKKKRLSLKKNTGHEISLLDVENVGEIPKERIQNGVYVTLKNLSYEFVFETKEESQAWIQEILLKLNK